LAAIAAECEESVLRGRDKEQAKVALFDTGARKLNKTDLSAVFTVQ
jgi:hypothetical protein